MSTMMMTEESPSIQQLQMELHLMTLKVDKLTKENVDLKQHIKSTIGNDSKVRHHYEVQSIEKDRLCKLVDQLKNEKKSLVETVLQLSNEVDAMHKASDLFESDHQRFVHAEMMINAARRRLGLQIIDALEMHKIGNDHPLMKEICVIINHESQPPHNLSSVDSADLDTKLPSPFLPTPTTVTSSSDSFATEDDTTHGERLQRLDAESLVANEHAFHRQSQLMHDALYRGNGTMSAGCHDNTASPHCRPTTVGSSSKKINLLRSNQKNGSGSVKSGESRRKHSSATLERNETESVISSVSTHRSSERSNKIKTNHKIQSQITAENLALLNKLNEEEDISHGATGNGSNLPPSNWNQPMDYGVRKTKTVEETVSWWPKLF